MPKQQTQTRKHYSNYAFIEGYYAQEKLQDDS